MVTERERCGARIDNVAAVSWPLPQRMALRSPYREKRRRNTRKGSIPPFLSPFLLPLASLFLFEMFLNSRMAAIIIINYDDAMLEMTPSHKSSILFHALLFETGKRFQENLTTGFELIIFLLGAPTKTLNLRQWNHYGRIKEFDDKPIKRRFYGRISLRVSWMHECPRHIWAILSSCVVSISSLFFSFFLFSNFFYLFLCISIHSLIFFVCA